MSVIAKPKKIIITAQNIETQTGRKTDFQTKYEIFPSKHIKMNVHMVSISLIH